MRIGTWNCRQNIDKKSEALSALALDVAVVPESSRLPALAQREGVSHAWRGDIDIKGLGVFGFGGWTINPIPERDPMPWCLPVMVSEGTGDDFVLLAVWTVKRKGDGRPSYAEQFAAVIDRWGDEIKSGDVVIAGDLNASLQGPSVEPHRENLKRLASLGMHSAFHLANGPIEAEEEPPTLRWIGPGKKPYYYHCDFVFTSGSMSRRLVEAEVGSLAHWVESGLSDHCPVTVAFKDRLHGVL